MPLGAGMSETNRQIRTGHGDRFLSAEIERVDEHSDASAWMRAMC
jgi:hypothetical protein